MKKLLFLVLMGGWSLSALAQPMPTYSNGPYVPGNGNSIPFSYQSIGCRLQHLYPANHFSAPAGQAINKIYFTTYNGLVPPNPGQYAFLEIKLGQQNLAMLNTGQWVGNMTTVFSESNYAMPLQQGEWFAIELETPFVYDPSIPLIVDVAAHMSAYTTWYVGFKSLPSAGCWRQYSWPYTSATPNMGNDSYEYYFGFDMISLAANNAGASILNPTEETCGDTMPVEVVIQNFGINQINGVTVEWEVNGVPQTPFTYTGTLDTINGAGSTSDTIIIGNYFFADSNDLRVWTTMPNNVQDTVNENDTARVNWYASYPQIMLDDDVICEGTFKIMNAGENWENVQWSTGATSASIIASEAGVYGVTVTDAYGCTDEKNIVITESPTPVVEFNAEEEACGQIALNAGNAGSTFAWSTGESSQVIVATESGGYVVTITNEDGCTGVGQTSVTIHDLPLMHLGEDFRICVDLYETRTLGGGTAYESYNWSSGETTSTITVGGMGATTGTMEYSVTVTDENNCSNSDTVVVSFENCIPAGINAAMAEMSMEVFPNPADDMVRITFNGVESEDLNVSLVDITGKSIQTIYAGQSEASKIVELDLTDISSGVYAIRARFNGKELTRQLIKK